MGRKQPVQFPRRNVTRVLCEGALGPCVCARSKRYKKKNTANCSRLSPSLGALGNPGCVASGWVGSFPAASSAFSDLLSPEIGLNSNLILRLRAQAAASPCALQICPSFPMATRWAELGIGSFGAAGKGFGTPPAPVSSRGKRENPHFSKPPLGVVISARYGPKRVKLLVFLGKGPASWCCRRGAFCQHSVPASAQPWVEKPRPLSAARVGVSGEGTGTWPEWGPRGTATLKPNPWPG